MKNKFLKPTILVLICAVAAIFGQSFSFGFNADVSMSLLGAPASTSIQNFINSIQEWMVSRLGVKNPTTVLMIAAILIALIAITILIIVIVLFVKIHGYNSVKNIQKKEFDKISKEKRKSDATIKKANKIKKKQEKIDAELAEKAAPPKKSKKDEKKEEKAARDKEANETKQAAIDAKKAKAEAKEKAQEEAKQAKAAAEQAEKEAKAAEKATVTFVPSEDAMKEPPISDDNQIIKLGSDEFDIDEIISDAAIETPADDLSEFEVQMEKIDDGLSEFEVPMEKIDDDISEFEVPMEKTDDNILEFDAPADENQSEFDIADEFIVTAQTDTDENSNISEIELTDNTNNTELFDLSEFAAPQDEQDISEFVVAPIVDIVSEPEVVAVKPAQTNESSYLITPEIAKLMAKIENESVKQRTSTEEINEKIFGGKKIYIDRDSIIMPKCFESSLRQADASLKQIYDKVKNELLCYDDVHARMITGFEVFRRGCAQARFAIKGKTLYVYLRIDPSSVSGDMVKIKDYSGKKALEETPTEIRVSGKKKINIVVDIIALMFEAQGITKNKNYVPEKFSKEYPYVEKGVIYSNNLLYKDQ